MVSPEVGSVFTWGRVPKSLMAFERRFCRCVQKSLMGSPVVGSVVTWGEGSVQGSGETSVLCVLFSPSSLALVNGCTLWPQPGASGSVVTVVIATRLLVGLLTL